MAAIKYWWVNHKQTFSEEVGGNYIWSPTTKANGASNHFYDNMIRTRPGDIVFSFADARIQAIGTVTGSASLLPKPAEFGDTGKNWGAEGWIVPVAFQRLNRPLRVRDHMTTLAPTLPTRYSPIQANGNGNQGAYLAHVPDEMVTALKRLLADQWRGSTGLPDDKAPPTLEDDTVPDETDEQVAAAINNRTDIGSTEKQCLVNARRGQGIYRQNLCRFESACRLTGVSDATHLRASHIKPWRFSTDTEKLDGNNGLLLSPHIDHLFDRGFITFDDDGSLLVSPLLADDVLTAWGIGVKRSAGVFRPEQLTYLEFHREYVFRAC